MSLIKFRNTRPAVDPFRSMFDDFFGSEFFDNKVAMRGFNTPAANIKETEKGYHIELAAPGMSKKDFDIQVDEDVLTISNSEEHENKEERDDYSVREFNYSAFRRSFRLPENVDGESIKAKYEDGMLVIDIPKVEQKVEKARQIEVE